MVTHGGYQFQQNNNEFSGKGERVERGMSGGDGSGGSEIGLAFVGENVFEICGTADRLQRAFYRIASTYLHKST